MTELTKKFMVKEFLDKYNDAPYDMYEVALIASQIKDNKRLSTAAKNYIHAEEEFQTALDKVGFQFG